MLSFLFIAALSFSSGWSGVHGQQLGSCTLRQFIGYAFSCQRTLMTNLALNHSLACTEEYKKEETCLTTHVTNCLTGTFYAAVTGDVVKLLQIQLYSCTSNIVDSTTINSLLLGVVKCDNQYYSDVPGCWTDFRSTINENRSDSSLCPSYSVAKSCAVRKMDEHCSGIRGLVTKDTFNPFCVNFTDPTDKATSTVSPTTVVTQVPTQVSTLNCSHEFYFDAAMACEREFVNASDAQCSWKPKLLACLTTNYTACLQPTADQALLEQLAETMLAVIKALYYICSSPPDTPDIRSLPGQITGIINCSQSFFTNLSSCLRNKTSEKADKCRDYTEFTTCYKEALKSSCSLKDETGILIDEKFNPFCENDNIVIHSGAEIPTSGFFSVLIISVWNLLARVSSH